MLAALEIAERLRVNKLALIAAHRLGDWESAKLLSQERQRLKKQANHKCEVCGVSLSRGKPTSRLCRIHEWARRYYARHLPGQ
jgi:hypothetical protein